MNTDYGAGTEQTSPLRRLFLRLEAAFWLTRPQSLFSKVPLAAAGWLVGRAGEPTTASEAAILVGVLAAMQGAMFTINDVFDAPKDAISAPYLPIPSGLVSRNAARLQAVVLALCFGVGCLLLAEGLWAIFAVVATMPPAFVTMKLYGRSKSAWYSPLLGSTASSSAASWAWLLAGAHNLGAFVLLFSAATLHGVHANLRAQLRDIHGDPLANNLTLAVRLGAKRTFWLAAAVRFVELGLILTMWLLFGAHWGGAFLLLAMVLLVIGVVTAPVVYQETRERIQQTEALSLWMYISFVSEIAMLATLAPMVAAATGLFMFSWFHLVRRSYYSRLVGGRLAREWKGRLSC